MTMANYKHTGKCCGTCISWEGSYWSNSGFNSANEATLQFGVCRWQEKHLPKPCWKGFTNISSAEGTDCLHYEERP